MGRLDERKREVTATEELPLDRAAPQPRLARGTDRYVKIDCVDALSLHRRFTDLRSLVIEIAEQLAISDQVRIFIFAPEPVFAWVDPMLIEHVLTSLLASALERSILGSSIVVRVEERLHAACISLTDNTLLPPEKRAMGNHDPDDQRMAVNREIVSAHGGSLAIEHLRNASTRCAIELPVATSAPRQQRLVGRVGLLIGNQLPHARELVPMLSAEGMRIDRCGTYVDGLRSIRHRRPDAIVIDADIPGATGVLPQLRALLPNVLLVLVSCTQATRLRSREPVILVNPIDAGEVFAVITRRLSRPDLMP